MDRNAIKKYAMWARRELIEKVAKKAMEYGVSINETIDIELTSINGRLLTDTEIKQRKALIQKVKEDGYEQVIEEVAYTWFNRFVALRFMEVNSYLPSHVRVFSNYDGAFKPQILSEALHIDLAGLDTEKVYELKSANKEEELFKYLLIIQCNDLSDVLPGMFQKIADYTELLIPDFLLREGSVIERLIADIPEDNFDVKSENGQVEIIGWLYQYYNTDLFNTIYDGDKSRKSLTANDIPAATQLFTPDWAVRYMVDNSLGKYWIDGHKNSSLRNELKYYLDNSEQPEKIQKQLVGILSQTEHMDPKELRVLDCCMGSGHILVYAFEVLMKIYIEFGYSAREAVRSIVENNLVGLDIDERATQLSYFAVMMKAREFDRRFLSSGIQPRVFAIKNSNFIDQNCLDYLGGANENIRNELQKIVDEFRDAQEYGSILKVSKFNYQGIRDRWNEIKNNISLYNGIIKTLIIPLVETARAMSDKYDIVVTNPPYLGSPRMNEKLLGYIKKYYEEGKADFSTVMYLCVQRNFIKENGLVSFISTNSWMYLKSFLKVRKESLKVMSFESIVDYGTELFEGKIGHLPIVAWVARKSPVKTRFHAVRLVDYRYGRKDEKQSEFYESRNHYYALQDEFDVIDGSPIVYWISENVINSFSERNLESFAEIVSGMTTGDNTKYLRGWTELDINKIAFNKTDVEEIDLRRTKWIPYHKGGEQRKWYGNHEYVVNWAEKNNFNRAKTTMTHVYLKPCITWSDISGNTFAGRYCFGGFMFDVKGSCAFAPENQLKILCAIFNSKIMPIYVEALNPTTTTQVGDIKRVPFIEPNENQKNVLIECVDECVRIAREEWDSFELSWDFKRHPLIQSGEKYIKDCFTKWERTCNERIIRMKDLETEINDILIDVYGLKDEINPEVDIEEVTLRKADLEREIKSLVSYAVGCMFGRYSLDMDGIEFAGGEWNTQNYSTYIPDSDAILPVSDDEYFEDDIVGKFVKFIEIVYGKELLEDNLNLISDCLGGKGNARENIRAYFMNGFYSDHVKNYYKRPIYWMFESGKNNAFKCLIYMHRYKADTIARIRTDYVHEQQSRYYTEIEGLNHQLSEATATNKVKINRRLNELDLQVSELQNYEEIIHHLADQMIEINLDDGVAYNYSIFNEVLASLK